ncbi:hypothetical protein PMAYCL1PPCAC_13814, partial [Pristionchus mayeri]
DKFKNEHSDDFSGIKHAENVDDFETTNEIKPVEVKRKPDEDFTDHQHEDPVAEPLIENQPKENSRPQAYSPYPEEDDEEKEEDQEDTSKSGEPEKAQQEDLFASPDRLIARLKEDKKMNVK